MLKIRQVLLCLLLAVVSIANAQSKIVTGQVTSAEDGEPIPGVTIQVKGQDGGEISNMDGNYSITVSGDDATLIFSFIGMSSQEIPISGRSVINTSLQSEAIGIDEVVITALGIKREEKALGYSATKVGADEFIKARNTNVVSSLSGKVAGVQIQATSSDPGAASSVIIRGFSSINGNNQPLYVVDGIPLQNSTTTTQGHSINTTGICNVANDDIESMTILKGAAATALYGSRASNGVIIITTKQGKKGVGRNFSISYNGSFQIRQVSLLPEFQNEFGQGWNGSQTYIENGSWGSRLDGSTQVYGPIWNNQQLIHTYSAVEDNVKDFFDLGYSHSHNVSISGTSEDEALTYYLSFTNSNDDGIMPTDADLYDRNVITCRSTFQGADWLKISSSFNFSNSKTDIVGSYAGTSVIDGLYEMPRDISIVDMSDLSSAFNTPEAYLTPYGITNPYWAIENNYNHTNSKKMYGKLQADIMPMDGLTLTYRFGFDYTDYDRKVGIPEIDLDDALINEDYGYAPSEMNQDGAVYVAYARLYELNHDFLASYDKDFDDFSLTVTAGVNINERYSTAVSGEVSGLTFDTGFWDLSNGASITSLSEGQSKRRLIGLFGDAMLGYKDMIFLNLVARNDWSSTLPQNNNNYFYPGATLSWVFTELLPKNNILSFGKVRLAYGKTGNDAGVYKTSTAYQQAYANGYYDYDIASFPMNGSNAFILGTTAGSADLKPEMTSETEIGVDLKFLDNKLGIDASYYNRTTSDQIFTLPVDPSTGYNKMVTNFGEVQNQGFEILLSTTPIRRKNIRWDLNFNFAKNYNKVLSMPASLDEGKVTIYSFSAGNDAVYMYAEKGKPMGSYYTYLPQYVDDEDSPYDGCLIVDDDGIPDYGDEVEYTGYDMNHKWTGGISTVLSAYGFSLSAQLDVRYGGTMFSRTKNIMTFTGNGIATLYNDRNPFVLPNSAVATTDTEGNTVYTENTSVISATDGTLQDYYDVCGPDDRGLYLVDRSYAKLRNISLSYTLPKEWIKEMYLSNVTLGAFVNNAFIWTAKDNYYIDPESTTTGSDLSGQFGELYSNPSCRIYGFNLSVTF